MKLYIKLFTVLLVAWNPTLAQSTQSKIKFLNAETFAVNDGLSQGLVNSITQDHFGFIWLGTLDGLNRYDGYKVTVYRHDPDDSSSVSDNFITSVFEDSKNRLWVGTRAGGLNYFDYEKERFVHFRHSANKNSISDDRILSIQEDAFGAIWVGTRNGLDKIVVTEKTEIKAAEIKNSGSSFPALHQLTIKHLEFDASGKELFIFREATSSLKSFLPSFFIDLKGAVFVRTESSYFCIHPALNLPDTVLRLDNLKAEPKEKKNFSDILSVTGLDREEEEFLFLMAKNSIAEIDALTGRVSLIKQFIPGTAQRHKANPFIEESRWFIYNFHLFQYFAANQQVIEVKSHEANEELLISNSTTLYKDHTGTIWVGTGGYGVLKFNPGNEKFHRVKSHSIHWLYSNTEDKVIIREGDSIHLLQKRITTPDSPAWQKDVTFFREIYGRLNGKYLGAAIQEKRGMVWLQADGIHKYDLQKRALETFLRKPISWSALYVDHENQFWFADEMMLCKINSPSAKVEINRFPLKGMAADFYVETIFKDLQNIVWIGTTYGLFSFDEERKKWVQYSFRSNDSTSLSSNLILSICASEDHKYLWIGTNGGGFNLFNKKTGMCKRYTTRNGLANNVIYGILMDKSGNLWMSTNNGISNFNPVTKKFENYTVEDGLQGNEFNFHAYCKTKDGIMFFGGVNGYNYFDPEEINPKELIPNVVITDIKYNGQSIDFREENSPLSVPLHLTKKIVFNFAHSTISFDFSAMLFKAYSHAKYEYMLEGIDEDWTSSSTNHSAVYSNLQPGNYVFKVKIGNLNNDYTAVDIIILPPWYRTWWFLILIILSFMALIYACYRYNLEYQIKRYKDHQRIASDLHDEIGSTLSSIHIYSEIAISKINNKPLETETYLRQISNSVENAIGSLDDIVWALKIKNDLFEDLGNRMRSTAVNICEASGYKLHLHFDERLNALKFGKETRKNLFLIYKEAVNNVMKYANGKNLFIDFSFAHSLIMLSIRDDGKGFDEKSKNGGNGLGNMKRRAKDLNGELQIVSSPGNGTNIILKFAL